MNQKSKKFQTRMLTCIVLVVFCLIVIAIFAYSYISRYESKKLDIKSRYTFSIDVDSNVTGYSNEDMTELAKAWLNKYVNQYRQRFVSYSMSVKKYGIDSVTMLDSDNNTVLLSFWVVPQDTESDYFSSWDGIMDNGVLKCEWVVSFYLDDNFNDTGTLYVTSVLSSEDYGLKQYYANLGIDSGGDTEVTTNSNKDQLANYVVRDNSLYITYDGGEKYVTVPASYSYLLYEDNSTTSLKEGSYMITTEKTAFVYGGKTANSTKVPVTVIYSDDKGENWTTCELDNIYNADYYYVKFFDVNNGVVICGYAKSNDTNESSRIYKTSNGGESWETVGSGPATNIIKGVVYVTADVGFFCYDYVDGMDSNLYKTDDGGKTFAKVILEAQELDSSAANSQNQESSSKADGTSVTSESTEQLKWNDVYKEALVPVVDSTGIITIYITQGKNGVYNDGKTAAKYQSSDNGSTWKYIGQMEIKD